jgi:hypothetical protein
MAYRNFDEEDMNRWGHIHIYIKSLDRRYKVNKRVGWVYIMRNPAFRGNPLKIGRTSRAPMERASELGASTSVPSDFELVYFVHVRDQHEAEKFAHEILASYRKTKRKEFFDVPLSRAIEALDQAAAHFPIPHVIKRGKTVLPLAQFFQPTVDKCPDCGGNNQVRLLMIKTKVSCRLCARTLRV